MFISALVTSGGVVFWEALFFIAFAVGLAEWLTGWKRAAATFLGVHLLALMLVLATCSIRHPLVFLEILGGNFAS